MSLAEEVKKYRIYDQKCVSWRVYDHQCYSAKMLINVLQTFMDDNKVEDAVVEPDVSDDCNGSFSGFMLYANVKKSDEELQEEVSQAKIREEEKKQAVKDRRKEQKEQEYQIYLRLQKKYGKSGDV